MGCATSKNEDTPALALCRERLHFLDEAIRQRYVLAESHVAYIESLRRIGLSLQSFFNQDLDYSSRAIPPLSPALKKKPDPMTQPEQIPVGAGAIARDPNSNSGSHLHFHSDTDDEDSVTGSPLHLHSGGSSPLHNIQGQGQGHLDYPTTADYSLFPSGFMNMNYMKNQTTPSVLYEQRPMSPATAYMGESSYKHSSYPYPMSNPNPNSYSYPYYGESSNYGGGANVYQQQQQQQQQQQLPYGSMSSPMAASSSKPPPPPPSPPPSGSAWDFLNPFENYDKFYSAYTPSRDSNAVRDEEGIPDLEYEDYHQQEVVKEVHGDQKFVDGGGGNYSKAVADEAAAAPYKQRPSVSIENDDGKEYEVRTLEKKVVGNEERGEDRGNVDAFKVRGGGSQAVSQVMLEIEVNFRRASESGSDFDKILEVGKLKYHPKNSAYPVSSKMLHVITPSLPVVSSHPSTSKNAEASSSTEKAGFTGLDFDEDAGGMRSGNLSSTLHKLYLWEKKLYDEIKAEEKMRVMHEKKRRRLKHLDERGAEAHKIDSTRTLIRSLSTKIRIAIQVVDKISAKIDKLRDEELWPQISEFIQGLSRMWKSMLECHRSQCQAIKCLDAIASHKKLGEAHLEGALHLKQELVNWTSRFYNWICAQKSYVTALNNWLLKCLMYVPEETPDGPVPFSPGRIGAPPVFVICNQWSQALERISEKEVLDSMRVFAMGVDKLCEQDKLEMRQNMMVSKDMERRVKNLEREDQKIQKVILAFDKMVLVSGDGNGLSIPGHIVYQSDISNINSLQVSLQRIFEAMERFTANSIRAYEELLQRIEEQKLAQEHPEVS